MVKVYQKEELKTRENEGIKIEVSQAMLNAILGGKNHMEALIEKVGLIFMSALMKEEAQKLAGKKYAREGTRQAYHWGNQGGYVFIHGKKVKISKMRLRSANEQQEIPLETYEKFHNESFTDDTTYNKIIRNISERNYEGAAESFCDGYGVKKSSISRRFIRASSKKLGKLLERELNKDNYVVIGIDGIQIGEFSVIVAIGITNTGRKRVLGLWLGGTENSAVCKTLLADLIRRGLNKDKNYLFVIDGSKGLKKAITDIFGEKSPVQRCQFHKRENVKNHLPEKYQTAIDMRLKAAYNMNDYREAKNELLKITTELKAINPSAAASLNEGLEETLAVHKLGIIGILKKTVVTTNFVESTFSMTRGAMINVKRWMNGNHIMRWAASALLEAERRFKRVRGWRELQVLDTKLNQKNVDNYAEVV